MGKLSNETGSYHGRRTGFEEIFANVLEPDFWPGITSGWPVIRSESQYTTSIPRVRKCSIPFRLTISTTPEPFGGPTHYGPVAATAFNCSSVAQNRLPFVFSIQYWVTWLAGEHRAPAMAPSA